MSASLALLAGPRGPHLETLIIYKLGSDQNCYTLALILLMHIVLCSKFSCTDFINYEQVARARWTWRRGAATCLRASLSLPGPEVANGKVCRFKTLW